MKLRVCCSRKLGMRKYFAGKVDHIRSAVESQTASLSTVRSLFYMMLYRGKRLSEAVS